MWQRFKIEESLSVSEIVTELTNRLGKELLQQLKNKKFLIARDRNRLIKKGIYNFDTEGKLTTPFIKVVYTVTFFKDELDYEYNDTSILNGGYCDYQNHIINVNLTMIDNNPSDNFYSTIQHEMNHFYQNDNGATKDENFYEKIVTLSKSEKTEDKWIAYVLYLSFNTEIDSFASQYYAYLKKKKPNIVSTDEYSDLNDKNNPYYNFNLAFEHVDNIDIDENNLREKLGITVNKLYNILNNAEQRLLTKIHKVWTKYISEINENKFPFNQQRMFFLHECYNKGIYEYDDIDF